MAKGKIQKREEEEETKGLRNGSTSIKSTKSFETDKPRNTKKSVEKMAPLERVNHELQGIADQYELHSQYIVPILYLLFFLFGVYYWESSLVNCTDELLVCLVKMKPKFGQIGTDVFKFSLCMFTIFVHAAHSDNDVHKYTGMGVPVIFLLYITATS